MLLLRLAVSREEVKAIWPKAVAIRGRKGWAVYTRRWGNRLTNWCPTLREAWYYAVPGTGRTR